jgi:thiol-disulfide isomerase/thioredoxin|tara:strand:+ start:458 stop:757 length:300 start_codon:yes stop_codon:yes gene_type:complete
MNELIKLEGDSLDTLMDHENLIVVFTRKGCGGCDNLYPYLKKLDKKYRVVLVDPIRHPKSTRFMPIPIDFYPKIGLFNRGYFNKELSQHNIFNQNIDTL